MGVSRRQWGLIPRRNRRIFAGEWTPASPTAGGYSPEHWYRSDGPLWQDAGLTAATADGDDIGRWEDKATNVDHVNQAVAGKKPTLQSGAADLLNGHPVLRFDGIDDYLQGAYTTGGALVQPFIVFAIAKLDAASVDDGGAGRIIDGDDNVNRHILFQNPAIPDTWGIYAGNNLTGAAASDANWKIWTALFNGAASRFWLNGVAGVAVGNAGAHAPDGLTVGAHPSGASGFWDGDIVEIIIYDANLSDADKNQVGRYLADRYGLSYTNI